MEQHLKIGELASRSGCIVETVRFYEKEGLLPTPARTTGNYRLYTETHVERLSFIRHCRSLDMTLEEIRSLLTFQDAPESDCGEVNRVLDKHITHVAQRIAELKGLQRQLKELRSLCSTTQASKDCKILQELSNMDDSSPKNFGTHNGGCH
jgi:Cd(II)/Pb(II)-responsive transcriptional regulator